MLASAFVRDDNPVMDATPSPTPEPNPYEPPHAPTPPPVRRPMGTLAAVGGVFLVILSSVIAFVVTCVPVGVLSFVGNINGKSGYLIGSSVPWVVGIAAGLLAGFVTARLVFRTKRRGKP